MSRQLKNFKVAVFCGSCNNCKIVKFKELTIDFRASFACEYIGFAVGGSRTCPGCGNHYKYIARAVGKDKFKPGVRWFTSSDNMLVNYQITADRFIQLTKQGLQIWQEK